MIKRIGILITVGFLLLIMAMPGVIEAQEEITVTGVSTQASFPSQLDFHLSAHSDVDITDIRLRYEVEKTRFADVTSEVFIEFTPSTSVDINWALEMVKLGGLPPGTIIDYWWVIKDAGGKKLETPPEQVSFDDNRFAWKMTSWGGVNIFWYQGNESFAQELVLATQNATSHLAAATGARLEKPVNLFIYANSQDLQEGMIFPQEWTGGVAFTRYNTLAIAIAPAKLDWGRKTIAHELTHLIVDQITINPYNDLPVWLEEGLAMYNEGQLEPSFTSIFRRAVLDNTLISLRSLASPFSAYTDESALSYAESYSVVEFLITSYGQSKMMELLNTFKMGTDYDDAFKAVYGFDMDGIEMLWRQSLTGQQRAGLLPQRAIIKTASYPGLEIGAGLTVPVIAVLGLAVSSRVCRRRW